MKTVLLIAYACAPHRGSEEGNGWAWSYNLALKGYNVWCLTNVEYKNAIQEELERTKLTNLHFVFIKLPYNLDKYLLNTSSKKIYFHYLIWQKISYKIASRLHNKVGFDIAHHVTYGSFQQGTFLWRLKNLKFIFGPVGGGQEALPEFKEYFDSGWRTEILRSHLSSLSLKFSKNLRETVKKSSCILVTNKETENLIITSKHFHYDKIYLISDTAVPKSMQNLEYINRAINKKMKLLWVGRLLPRKGIKLILHALSQLPENIDYSLSIVGGGEQFSKLDGWIKEYGLDASRLNILGQIPFSQVVDFYKDSDVFLFCSLRDSNPAQFNEAMAFSLPIITLDIHGSALAVPDDCGIKVKPTTKEATAIGIAEAIATYYFNPELRILKSINSHKFAQSNTWEKKIDFVTSNLY